MNIMTPGGVAPRRSSQYTAPREYKVTKLRDLLDFSRRFEPPPRPKTRDLFNDPDREAATEDKLFNVQIFYAGHLEHLRKRCVAVVGKRKVSAQGEQRAKRIARELVAADVTVVSGLAKGVDTAAHTSAITAGGRTVAVIGTPLEKAYPAENAHLQECIYQQHLLISQFAPGAPVYPTNFPARNKVMAALCDATVIVEADDESGSLHQAIECVRLSRWLFILKSVADDTSLRWPKRFIKEPRVRVLETTQQLLRTINERDG